MSVKIGGVKINSRLALAPMAGVSDLAFRAVCRNLGAGLTFTEMASSKALMFQDKKTRVLLKIGADEHPSCAQIFGSDASCMGDAASRALEISGADIIDINMGCPVGKVVRGGDGCALMRDPDKAFKIIKAVSSSISAPVTVKIRKGWDRGGINAVEFAKMAEEAGAAAVTVHGRTRTQMYSGTADPYIIRDVKNAVRIPVIANGDIFKAEDAERMLRVTGADMVMIGRGAFGNPWIFEQAAALIEGREKPALPPLSARIDLAMSQFEMMLEYKSERVACLEARKHFAWYLKGVRHSNFYKEKIMRIQSFDDIYAVGDGIKRDLE